VGVAISQFYRLVLLRPFLIAIANVPGSAGDLLALVLVAGPWILLMVSGFVPTLVVRSARRLRVRAIEQDLPLALELFATMAEAGLGFDAALAKVVRAQGSNRPLASEFLNFQHDMMAGMSRTQALRQLGRRVDIPSLSTFTSALVQAEQVGASMAETLQHQANDLRQRRRENALLQAQALPVKLVFPLVVCFLPGIFATTLSTVGRTVRDRIELSRRVRAQSVEAHASVGVVLLITYVLGFLMWRTNPDRLNVFLGSSIGTMVVAAVIAMQAVGLIWMSRLNRTAF